MPTDSSTQDLDRISAEMHQGFELLHKDIDDVMEILHTFIEQVDSRFTKVEASQFRLESKMNELSQEVADLKQSHNRLLNTIDGFIGRIDRYEIEQAARDSQFERLLSWARKVSAQTGIPLENL